MPQETEPSPSSEQIAANLKKTEQETRKLAAEASKAEFDAYSFQGLDAVSVGTLDVPEGAVSPIATIAAYYSLRNIAEEIEKKVSGEVRNIWLVSPESLARSRAAYRVVKYQLLRLVESLTSARGLLGASGRQPETFSFMFTAATVGAVASLASSALPAIASLLKDSTKVRIGEIEVSFLSLAAVVAEQLRARRIGPGQDSSAVGVSIYRTGGDDSEELDGLLDQVRSLRDQLAADLTNLQLTLTDGSQEASYVASQVLDLSRSMLIEYAKKAEVTALTPMLDQFRTAAADVAAGRSAVSNVETKASVAQKAIDAVDAFIAQLESPAKDGSSVFSLASEFSNHRSDHVLTLDASFAAAESQWEEVAARKDRALHMGSVAVTYVLTAPSGRVIASGIESKSKAATTKMGSADISW